MKIAYFVLGPESSGTRMLTKSFCVSGIYGDFKHKQRMDNLNFSQTPDQIVLRRSLPHGHYWPAIASVIKLMKQADYQVIPILILRDKDATIQSQIRHKHTKASEEIEGRTIIQFSIEYAYKELASVGLFPCVINYEAFVKSDVVRKCFYAQWGLPEPPMEFYDGNEKYASDEFK